MPKYVFECEDCAVRFDRTLKMGDHITHPCPSCKEEAPQVIEGFAFAFAKGNGPVANSGVHDHDYPTADKAVGRSSDERWTYLSERDQAKAKAREAGATHALMRSHGPGYVEYTPMSTNGMEARRRLAKQAIEVSRAGKSGGR